MVFSHYFQIKPTFTAAKKQFEIKNNEVEAETEAVPDRAAQCKLIK